jgi:uncharacterized protein
MTSATGAELRPPHQTLVVLQPGTFCNINCSYCYLPDRGSSLRMSNAVLRAAFDVILGSSLVRDPFVFVWHLGEPLAVPTDFYEEAFGIAAEAARRHGRQIGHAFQTNGTLLNDAWVALITRHDVRIGVSLDGPAFIHDRHRRTRRDSGTHAAVMRGIGLLRESGTGFGVISVVTDYTLDYADEFYSFFLDQGISRVALNTEEIEGGNKSSSLASGDSVTRYERFFDQILELSELHAGAVKIREIWENAARLAFGGPGPVCATNQPFRNLTVDHLGNIATFSPELLTARTAAGPAFAMGNVLTGPLDAMTGDPVFLKVSAEIAAGVELCRRTCAYWRFCGGGAPSNKFFEHGRFDVAETAACRVHKQATVRSVLRHLEHRAGLG